MLRTCYSNDDPPYFLELMGNGGSSSRDPDKVNRVRQDQGYFSCVTLGLRRRY